MWSAQSQGEFARALFGPGLEIPAGVIGPRGEASFKRFSVYRNNVAVGLTEALRAAFPAVLRLVGTEFFDGMAGVYLRANPPRSPIMHAFGDEFPAFIARFEPASSLPYLADVGRIEWAWVCAYHAPDAAPLGADSFFDISPSEIPHLRLALHPSLRVVSSDMPALSIWRMNLPGNDPAPLALVEAEDALIVRPESHVEVRSLPPGAAAFITALGEGHSIMQAGELALVSDGRFDLRAGIAGLIEAGAIIGFQHNGSETERRGA